MAEIHNDYNGAQIYFAPGSTMNGDVTLTVQGDLHASITPEELEALKEQALARSGEQVPMTTTTAGAADASLPADDTCPVAAEEAERCDASAGPGDTAASDALTPLPWRELFEGVPGVLDSNQVTARLRRVHKEFSTIYFDCSEEAFVACFGLPEGSTPRPVTWQSNARALNYFMKCLYPARVPSWELVTALFVKDDGTPYSNLCKQILTDDKERQAVKAVFDKISGKTKGNQTKGNQTKG